MSPGRLRAWMLGAALALGAAAPAPAVAATLVDDRGHRIELAQPPQRVISLLPSLTESVCALGACGRLVGTDRYSTWPDSVKALPKLGGLDDTPIERIVTLKPDLVLVAGSARAIDRLEALGLRVVALEPRSLADTQRVLGQLATALGDPAAGPALWQRIEARLRESAARVPASQRGRSVYFEVAAAPYAAGESSFVGEVLARLGLVNVVPAALGPFPKLNPEFVLRAQPDIVMAAQRALAEMPQRPGWGTMKALREHRSCGFANEPYEVMLRPGPRLADGAVTVVDCLVRLDAARR